MPATLTPVTTKRQAREEAAAQLRYGHYVPSRLIEPAYVFCPRCGEQINVPMLAWQRADEYARQPRLRDGLADHLLAEHGPRKD